MLCRFSSSKATQTVLSCPAAPPAKQDTSCTPSGVIFQYLKMKVDVSERKHKKYVAILDDGSKVHFGDKRYPHFKDRTPLKAFKHLDHGDEKRRKSFHARFKHSPKNSAGYFALKFLW